MNRDDIIADIVDKLNGFLIKQIKVFIRTIPLSHYPRGRFISGLVREVYANRVSIMDKNMNVLDIYYSEIESPASIEEFSDVK